MHLSVARMCVWASFWSGQDPHRKDRLFGLNNAKGNHGDDVKRLYYCLDATPTGSYAKRPYMYPEAALPYPELIHGSAKGASKTASWNCWIRTCSPRRGISASPPSARRRMPRTCSSADGDRPQSQRAGIAVLATLTFRAIWD